MKIKVGKYTLRSDRYSYWIDEEYEQKNGKVEIKRITGYCTSLTRLLQTFCERKVGGSDAEDLEELIVALRRTLTEMKTLSGKATENGIKEIERIARKRNGRN